MTTFNIQQRQISKPVKSARPNGSEMQISSAIPYRIWYERGKLLTQQGCYEAAIASFDTALSLQANEHRVWIYRGIALAYLACYEAALASFNQAVELVPNNRAAWIFRGATLTYLKRPHEAFNSYRIALTLPQPGNASSEHYPTTWLPQPPAALQEKPEDSMQV